jgi:ABC-type antimicrobial peptide transport system permease subunit
MRLLAGRGFTRQDAAGSAPVVVVNARVAARLFGAESPLGHTLHIGRNDDRQPFTIVGVVENSAYQFVNEEGRAIAYLPYRQAAAMLENRNLGFQVKTSADPVLAMAAVRDTLGREDARVPLRIETLDARIAESLVQERTLALLATTLGALALLLAAAALYGLIAYAATARTREFGVRIALGATPAAIGRLVLRDAAFITVVGVVAGLALTLMLGKFARTLLTAITPGDPTALGVAIAVVVTVTLAAALGPAWRSGRVQPTDALRVE